MNKEIITFDRVIGVLGILLSIPVFLEFFNQRFVNALLLIIVMLLIAVFLIYRYFDEKRPLFTYLKVEKKLIFRDRDAHIASQESVVEVRANHTGVTQLWFRSINADGPVGNFIIDGEPVPQHLIQKKAGNFEVCKQFEHALKKGDTATVLLNYDMTDAFPKNREGTSHNVVTITKKLKIRIEFHPQKVGRNVRSFIGAGAGLEKALDPPRPLNGGAVLEMELEDLELGAYYTIEWVW